MYEVFVNIMQVVMRISCVCTHPTKDASFQTYYWPCLAVIYGLRRKKDVLVVGYFVSSCDHASNDDREITFHSPASFLLKSMCFLIYIYIYFFHERDSINTLKYKVTSRSVQQQFKYLCLKSSFVCQ